MTCLIIPIGVTRETVENILKGTIEDLRCVITVTIPGYEETKQDIVNALETLARMAGIKFYTLTIKPWSHEELIALYKILKNQLPQKIVLVGTTGSRYIIPPLLQVLLYYWKSFQRQVYIAHGVEGEAPRLVPLPGYISTALNLGRMQEKILKIIYSTEQALSGKKLIHEYNLTRAVYAALAELENKGLVRVKRGRIEKTFPGTLLYHLLEESGEP